MRSREAGPTGGSIAHLAPLIALLLLCACARWYTPRHPLPIAEVVELSKSTALPAAVIERIRESGTTYALRGSDFAKLKALGVPDPVLDYLQQSLMEDVDLLTRYWVLGEGLGACSFCYPQPVDVDKLESGYGMVAAVPPGRYQPGKPPGVPDWVPASLFPAKYGALTLDQITKMVKEGVPDEQIIERIRHSRLAHVIGVGGLHLGTRPVAGLTGAELAHLHAEGASYAVLDAVQAQYVAQFIAVERLRYQNLGKGPASGSMQ